LVVVQACVGVALCHRAGGRWRAVVDGNGPRRWEVGTRKKHVHGKVEIAVRCGKRLVSAK
jgi:hypothetical protein